jgi:hypothetical protein
MEIQNSHVPLLLQAVRDAIRYKELLLKSDTLRDVEDHEENLMHLGELLSYLKEVYAKNQDKFKYTPEEILGEK